MPSVRTPGRVIQDMKIVPTTQLNQAGTYVGSNNIGRCWIIMIIMLINHEKGSFYDIWERIRVNHFYMLPRRPHGEKTYTMIDDTMSNDENLKLPR